VPTPFTRHYKVAGRTLPGQAVSSRVGLRLLCSQASRLRCFRRSRTDTGGVNKEWREEGAESRRRGATARHPSPAGPVSYAETIKLGTPCCANTVGGWRRNPQVIGNSLIYGTRKDVSNQGKLFFVVSSPGFEKLCVL
jgi:hypothetical protein